MTGPRRSARRDLLRISLVLPAALIAGGLTGGRAQAQSPARPAACPGPTPRTTEGPFFKPRSPRRVSLVESGVSGTPLVLTGTVRWTDCTPIAGALLDFWQADGEGAYDNQGYRLRGHQLADDQGRYTLTTVLPGRYPGRTPHLHVKVQPPGQPALTTQLYFPDEAQNARDGLFDPALLVTWRPTSSGKAATFDFVLKRLAS